MRGVAVWLALVGCGGGHDEPVEVPVAAQEAPEGPIVGGWSEADPASEQIRTASQKIEGLLRERTGDVTLTITRVASARTQIVAGTNHELVIDVNGRDGAKTNVNVVAWQNPQDEWALTTVEGL